MRRGKLCRGAARLQREQPRRRVPAPLAAGAHEELRLDPPSARQLAGRRVVRAHKVVPPLALGALHKVVVLALVLRPPGQQRKVGLQQLGRPLLQHREERLALRLREELAVAVQAERRVVRAVADRGRAAELHAVGEQPLAAKAPQLRCSLFTAMLFTAMLFTARGTTASGAPT